MTSFDDALASVLSLASSKGVEEIPVEDGLGRYLASDFHAKFDSPLFDNSSVDGFAVRSSDVTGAVSLPCVGVVYAGDENVAALSPGTTVRVMTGAAMPEGANAMVMQEDVAFDGEVATFSAPVKSGQAVRKRGEEFRAGDLLVRAGGRLTSQSLALIAGQGCSEVSVGVRPVLSLIVTGSELAQGGEALKPGQIYESNSVSLSLRAMESGVERPVVRSVGDDVDALREAFEAACQESDVVVFSGGASVGEKDLVRRMCLSSGVEEVFWRINMKPGKPVFFGRRGSVLVFALPGNPVSAQVTFHLLVAPVLRAMSGCASPGLTYEDAVLGTDVKHAAGRKEFVRAMTRNEGGRLVATPIAKQGSHMSSGMAMADRLIVVGEDEECLKAGSIVKTVPL